MMNQKVWIWMPITPEHEKEFEKAVKEDRKKRCKCSIFNIIDTKRSAEEAISEICHKVLKTDKDIYTCPECHEAKKRVINKVKWWG